MTSPEVNPYEKDENYIYTDDNQGIYYTIGGHYYTFTMMKMVDLFVY